MGVLRLGDYVAVGSSSNATLLPVSELRSGEATRFPHIFRAVVELRRSEMMPRFSTSPRRGGATPTTPEEWMEEALGGRRDPEREYVEAAQAFCEGHTGAEGVEFDYPGWGMMFRGASCGWAHSEDDMVVCGAGEWVSGSGPEEVALKRWEGEGPGLLGGVAMNETAFVCLASPEWFDLLRPLWDMARPCIPYLHTTSGVFRPVGGGDPIGVEPSVPNGGIGNRCYGGYLSRCRNEEDRAWGASIYAFLAQYDFEALAGGLVTREIIAGFPWAARMPVEGPVFQRFVLGIDGALDAMRTSRDAVASNSEDVAAHHQGVMVTLAGHLGVTCEINGEMVTLQRTRWPDPLGLWLREAAQAPGVPALPEDQALATRMWEGVGRVRVPLQDGLPRREDITYLDYAETGSEDDRDYLWAPPEGLGAPVGTVDIGGHTR